MSGDPFWLGASAGLIFSFVVREIGEWWRWHKERPRKPR